MKRPGRLDGRRPKGGEHTNDGHDTPDVEEQERSEPEWTYDRMREERERADRQ